MQARSGAGERRGRQRQALRPLGVVFLAVALHGVGLAAAGCLAEPGVPA